MAEREDSSIATSLMTFLLGVAVGAAVAILYAPQAGSETRQQIAEKAGQLKDKASELKDTVAERAQDWKEKAAAVINHGGSEAENAGRRLVDAKSGENSS